MPSEDDSRIRLRIGRESLSMKHWGLRGELEEFVVAIVRTNTVFPIKAFLI